MDNLDNHAKAAKQAGLSYGEYMRRRYVAVQSEPPRERILRRNERICAICGAVFIKHVGNQKYCKSSCADEARLIHMRGQKRRKK